MLSLQNVTKLYGTVIGVNDVSAELGQGAHGLLGPNGVSLRVITIWMAEYASRQTKFITLFPDKEG